MAASVVHIPLEPMTLEINAVSSEYVTWTYRWKDVDLSADFETYSQNFGHRHPDGWIWRMLFQQNVDSNGNRVYGVFLYVVMNDNELQERSWTRDIRYLQFVILNSEGRQLKDKTTVAMYRENQLSWGFPGLLDNSILMRDPVVSSKRTVDIVCRLRYHPDQERMRRAISPGIPGSLSVLGAGNPVSRAASVAPVGFWDPKATPTAPSDSVGKNLRKLLNSPDFSDLELIVGPERCLMHGHKAILAARSDWFRSALRPGFREAREGRIVLAEDDPKIFEALLEFLYTGDYPLSPVPVVRRKSSAAKSQDSSIHMSPRSPPTILPRSIAESQPPMNSIFGQQLSPRTAEAPFEYRNGFETPMDISMDGESELDEQKYMLFMMADKYGVSELKNMLRLQLSSELLDLTNNTPPGPRLLRLIRFAFEELPESTTPRSGRESAGSNSRAGSASGIHGRVDTPPTTPAFSRSYAFAAPGVQSNSLQSRDNITSAFGQSSLGAPGTTNGRAGSISSPERKSESDAGIYGRDNETALLRESITAYVAKMFHVVRQLDGFDELLRDGGELGGFVKMVMEYMYWP